MCYYVDMPTTDELLKRIANETGQTGEPAAIAKTLSQMSDAALERIEPFGGWRRELWWAEMTRRGLR